LVLVDMMLLQRKLLKSSYQWEWAVFFS